MIVKVSYNITTPTIRVTYSDNSVYVKTTQANSSIFIKVGYGIDHVNWGDIGGTLSDQVDLQSALDAKVDDTTTITINGTTQDLSANRTWTVGDMLKSVYDTDDNGIVDHAESMVTTCRNSTGSTIYKGTIVYLSGSTGNRPNILKAIATSDATSAQTFGVVEDDIANNSDGRVVTLGTISNLDTRSSATHPFTSDTLADGDILYLSPTTPGYVTNVKPYAPNHIVYVGMVVRTHPTLGTIVYRIQNGYELDELHNVSAQTPSNNDGLFYESSTSLWKNKSIATVLGYTPANASTVVPTSRTLTINGTAYDLSADRSWTISATATPAGSNTQIQYNDSGAFGASAGFTYDNSTGVLSLTKNQNAATYLQITNTNNAVTSGTYINMFSSGSSYGQISKLSQTGTASAPISAGDFFVYNSNHFGDIVIFNGNNSGKVKFSAGGIGTAQMTITAAGRLLLGTTTEATYLLDVNGTGRFSNSNGNTALTVYNTGINVTGAQYLTMTVQDTNSNQGTMFALKDSTNYTLYNHRFLYSTMYRSNSSLTSISPELQIRASSIDIAASGRTFTTQALRVYLDSTNYDSDGIALIDSSGNPATNGGITFYSGGGTTQVNGRISAQQGASGIDQRMIFYIGNSSWNFVETMRITNDAALLIGGTTKVASSILTMTSTTRGFLMPRMTTTQRDAITTPATGLSIYNTTLNTNDYYNGTAWVSLAAGNIYTADGTLTGNRTVTNSTFTLTFNGGLAITNGKQIIAGQEYIINGYSTTSGNNLALRLNNTTTTTGRIWDIRSVNDGSFDIRNQSDSKTGLSLTKDGAATILTNITAQGGLLNLGTFGGVTSGAWFGTSSPSVSNWSIVGDGTSTYFNAASGGNLYFRINNADKMLLASTGNFIIGGTTDAGYKLDVQGTGRFTGAIYTGNTSNVGVWMVTETAIRGTATTGGNLYIDANSVIDNTGTINLRGKVTTSSTLSVGGNLTVNGAQIFVPQNGGIRGSTSTNGNLFLDPSLDYTGNIFARTTSFVVEYAGAFPTTYASALFVVNSTTKGFLPPRMTNAQRTAIATPAVGLMVYCTDAVEGLYIYKSTGWTFVI